MRPTAAVRMGRASLRGRVVAVGPFPAPRPVGLVPQVADASRITTKQAAKIATIDEGRVRDGSTPELFLPDARLERTSARESRRPADERLPVLGISRWPSAIPTAWLARVFAPRA